MTDDPATPKPTPEDLIDNAQRQRRVYRLSLAGHLVPKLQQMETELGALIAEYNADAPKRVGGRPPHLVKADEIEALQAEMDEHAIDVVLEQRERDVFREFKAANPPRDDNPEDERAGVNFAAVEDVFLRACVVEPQLSEERWQRLVQVAPPGDVHDMAAVAWNMHTLGLSIPKSRLVSAARKMSDGD
jgi:hypothetical protein